MSANNGQDKIAALFESFEAIGGSSLKNCELISEAEFPAHYSHPAAFVRLRTDELLNLRLGLDKSVELFGRCNMLMHGTGEPLAEVIEIIPPLQPKTRSTRMTDNQNQYDAIIIGGGPAGS